MIDICVISTFSLLWIYVYKFHCERMFLILLGIHLKLELLVHMAILCLTLKELWNCFPKKLNHCEFPPTTCAWGFQFLHILVNTCFTVYLLDRHIEWIGSGILLWFWFAFFWRQIMLNIFSYDYWPFLYLLYINIYASHLTMLNSVYWKHCFPLPASSWHPCFYSLLFWVWHVFNIPHTSDTMQHLSLSGLIHLA